MLVKDRPVSFFPLSFKLLSLLLNEIKEELIDAAAKATMP